MEVLETSIPSVVERRTPKLALAALFITSAIPYSNKLAGSLSFSISGALLAPLEVIAIFLSIGAILYKPTRREFMISSVIMLYLIAPFLVVGIYQNGIQGAIADIRAIILIPATYSWARDYIRTSSNISWRQCIIKLSCLTIVNAAAAKMLGGLWEGRLLGLSEPIIVTLLCLLVGVRELNALSRYSLLGMTVIIMAASGTRGMWLSTFIAVLAIVAVGLISNIRTWHASFVGFVIVIVTVSAIYISVNNMFAERVFSFTRISADPSLSIRTTDITLALQMANQRPILGFGFGKPLLTTTYYKEGMYIDNTWVTAYVKGGIILVAELLILLFVLASKLLPLMKLIRDDNRIWMILAIGWLAYIFTSSLRCSLIHSPPVLMLGALCYAIVNGQVKRGARIP